MNPSRSGIYNHLLFNLCKIICTSALPTVKKEILVPYFKDYCEDCVNMHICTHIKIYVHSCTYIILCVYVCVYMYIA